MFTNLFIFIRLLKYLIPQIEEFTTSGRHGIPDENQILDFIKRTTMVGLLPQPPIIGNGIHDSALSVDVLEN
jgi:hypothetical protein